MYAPANEICRTGLDANRFKKEQALLDDGREFHNMESQISDTERFKLCDPLKLRCRVCRDESEFGGLMDNSNDMLKPSGIHCGNIECQLPISTASAQVQVENHVRAAIARFYESWVVCDDQSCGNRTRMIGMWGKRCLKPDCRGQMQNEVSKMSTEQVTEPCLTMPAASTPTLACTTSFCTTSLSSIQTRLGTRS